MDKNSVMGLLKEALAPDTERVKKATATLKKDYYKNPQSLSILLQILTDDDVPNEVRQIAATQARSLVPRHWNSVPESHRPQIRKHMLDSTLQEENSAVRHISARVVAAIASIDSKDGEWEDLPQTLVKNATSNDAKEREVGTYLLFAILDVMAEESTAQFGKLFQLYGQTIHDPESADVRINTMLGLSKMALYIEGDEDKKSLQSIQKLVPEMVGVLKQAIDARDEERELQCFEVFQNLLEAPAPILNPHFAELVKFMMEIAGESSLDKDARVAGLNFLVSCVMYRKTKFQALRVGEQMVERLLHILFTTEESLADEEEFGVTMSVLTMLNLMSSQLPPSQAVVPVIQLFKKFAGSNEARQRQAVLMALAASVEGAPEFLDTQMGELKPYILRLLNDPELKVREQAVSATKELAEALPEAIGKDHQAFMSVLAKNLDAAMSSLEGPDAKTNLDVVINCCTAIDNLVDGLEKEDLQPYLAELVPHMSKLFAHDELKVKAASIAAVGSIAESAGDAFLPYFEGTMNLLQDYVQYKEGEDELNLRSLTVDAMGDLALAVGKDHFSKYIQPLMRVTEEGLTIDSPRLKETSYLFWATMAKVYGEDFKPFLAGTVKTIFEALEQKEQDVDFDISGDDDLVDAEVIVGGKKVKVVQAKDEDDDDMDDDSDAGSDWDDLIGVSAVAQEKEVAAEALAEIFSNAGKDFMPYFEKAVTLLLPLIDNAFEGLRRASISALFRAYGTLWQLSESEWEAGLPLQKKPSNELAKFGEILMTTTLGTWGTEDDENIVMEIHRNLAETFKLTGPTLLVGEGVIEQIVQTLVSVLQKKHLCQQTLDSDSEDDELESSEQDAWIIESAMDTIAGLANALGSQFGELWKIFSKPILGYASASEATARSAAVGGIAESIRGMGAGCTQFTGQLLPVLMKRLADEDSQVKSNAAFAVGMLVEKSEDTNAITKAYSSILEKLEPLLGNSESRQRDNAAGALARLITAHPDRVPLDDVLPALVHALPLEDWDENTAVYSMLHGLMDQQAPALNALREPLKLAIAKVLAPPEDQLDEDTRAKVQQMAQHL